MEKAESKLNDLKTDELKKASFQKGAQTPTSQVPVNNHQDDRMPDSACASGPVGWKEQPSKLICTPLPSASVSTPRGQERCIWFSRG
ncbi:hypothetical protein AMECASPLE_029030 [Ameca splendens]|uniref:Uncharacterized protein n=1 Tax=Ameca splendens TaxID=208324 RepID=A0ABV0XUL3_9TELE